MVVLLALAGCPDPVKPALEDPCESTGIYDDAGRTYPSIQDAVETAMAGTTVHLCPGEYATSVSIERNLTLSGSGAEVTSVIWDEEWAYGGTTAWPIPTLVVVASASVSLLDLTIRDGHSVAGAALSVADGGSVRADRVIFEENGAGYGGAIYIFGSVGETVTLSSCVLRDNEAGWSGGAAAIVGNARLVLEETELGEGDAANTPDDVAIFDWYPDTVEGTEPILSWDGSGVVSITCDAGTGTCE